MHFLNKLTIIAACMLGTLAATADEANIPEPFRGSDASSPFYINYGDLSAVLRLTVIETGQSERRALRKPKPSMGTRIQRGNPNATRHEGNRVLFHAFSDTEANWKVLSNIKKDLEAVPDEVPMRHWKKSEQLAYWLNLHNIAMFELILEHYPVRSIKKLTTGPDSILEEKVLKVSGLALSLNDIRHTIIAEKWGGTLPMYGLFMGYVGGPNIRNQAYTGNNVYRMLEENAREFVNSNRGMRVDGRTLKVSEFYDIYRAKFPDWKDDVKNHVMYLAEFNMRSQIHETSRVRASTKDYYIADLYGGSRNTGTSVNTNNAAFDSLRVPVNANIASGGFRTDSNPFIEPHIIEMLDKVRMRRYTKDGTVKLEALERRKNKKTESEMPEEGTPQDN